MKISQIAICVGDMDANIKNLNQAFGFDFYKDSLKMKGYFNDQLASDPVNLLLGFNHNMMDGVELEFISSDSYEHWHKKDNRKTPFLSHLGVYCDSEDEFYKITSTMMFFGFNVLQDSTSFDHSNKRVGDGEKSSRSYQDVIFDSEEKFGFNLKLSLKVK